MKARAVICRFCGKPGRETDGDVAPGVCPACLDARMEAATERLGRLVATLPLEEVVAQQFRHLCDEVGLTPEAARLFLQTALDLAFVGGALAP